MENSCICDVFEPNTFYFLPGANLVRYYVLDIAREILKK